MSNAPHSSGLRRLWKPAVAGAGGTALAVWFEEIMVYAEQILALVFVPVLAAVIYLFNIFIFKSRQPRREDIQQPGDKK